MTPFIHALAPRLIAFLYGYANPSQDTIIQHNILKSVNELNTVLECIAVMETLLALTDPSNRK